MYLYITTRSEPEIELINAECLKMTGAIPDSNGIAIREDIQDELNTDISRSAYIKTCLEVISHTHSLYEIYSHLERLNLHSEGFRVSVCKIPKGINVDSQKVMYDVGLRIGGNPNLKNPKTTFLVVITKNDIWLGKVISESSKTWNEHIHKSQQYSSALPARMARAMINLAVTPGDRIIDPCCGSGTILIEAVSIGINATGYDINSTMVQASRENLRHFGLEADVEIGDARNIEGRFDAVITDLPYGKNCLLDDQSCFEIIKNLPQLAPKAVIVAGSDMEHILLKAGYKFIKIIKTQKGALARYIHNAKIDDN